MCDDVLHVCCCHVEKRRDLDSSSRMALSFCCREMSEKALINRLDAYFWRDHIVSIQVSSKDERIVVNSRNFNCQVLSIRVSVSEVTCIPIRLLSKMRSRDTRVLFLIMLSVSMPIMKSSTYL